MTIIFWTSSNYLKKLEANNCLECKFPLLGLRRIQIYSSMTLSMCKICEKLCFVEVGVEDLKWPAQNPDFKPYRKRLK